MDKVIIIGGGIAGPALAIQLKQTGYQPVIYEARPAATTKEGAFLGITPNGLNVLKQLISLDELKRDYTTGSMRFYNQQGREIANLMTGYQLQQYGVETMQIKRADLHEVLRQAADEHEIPVFYDKKCIAVQEFPGQVHATFSDGTTASGDLLIGCDGTFSAVRQSLFPVAEKPIYTKNISTGGYAHLPDLDEALDATRMAFGERGFFAYNVSNQGEIWWFNNYYRQQEPSREEVANSLPDEIKRELCRIHQHDDPLFSRIIRASTEILVYPVYDIPRLRQWHGERVCLIGDAAHATSPHIGQGASLALEDTVCLVQCLQSLASPKAAFADFQQRRQGRVEKIVKGARKVGNAKSKPNRIATWFRDRFLGTFIQAEIKKLDWIYGYRSA